MVALVTRALLLLQSGFSLAIALALLATGRAQSFFFAFACGFAFIVLLRLAISLNNFYLAYRFGSETPLEHQLNVWGQCRLFIREFGASLLTSSYTMPFCRFDRRETHVRGMLPVLLVHGYLCNSGYWHSMSKALLQTGITHRAVDLEPVTAGIDDYAGAIQQAVEALCKDTGSEKVVVVAHSMGGLAMRAFVRAYGARQLARVITLGTPHNGTHSARFGIGENCLQMDRQGTIPSPWLQELAARESEETRRLFVSIYSHQDNIIAPQNSSHLPGATNIALHGVGHVALGLDPGVQALVVEEVREASRATAISTS